ncbi:MAG: diguanylate cyclase domain-containing protein, partial [Stackebrandtia sp.]
SPAMFAARLSGDEFALLIDDRDGGAMLTAQAAWRTIAAAPVLLTDGQQVDVTASVGVAVSRIGADPRVLLHEADLAMYAAKRDDGRVRLYTPDAGDTPGAVATRPAVRPRDRRHPGPAPLYPPAHSGRRRRP